MQATLLSEPPKREKIMMRPPSSTFLEFMDEPVRRWSRVLLVVLIIPLLVSFAFPLWRISMYAPQYPKGIFLDIYAHRLAAGHDGADLDEINTLNHYIGMHKITRDELRDLEWIPAALGVLGLLALRVAAVGNVRALVDAAVLTAYVSLFAFGRFVYMLYDFGHHLDPTAPVRMDPFMPVVLGAKQVANFTTYSFPMLGSLFMGLFAGGLTLITIGHLYVGWKRSRAARAAA
jgi:hypothetical protein